VVAKIALPIRKSNEPDSPWAFYHPVMVSTPALATKLFAPAPHPRAAEVGSEESFGGMMTV
jgi:hypothetical protein